MASIAGRVGPATPGENAGATIKRDAAFRSPPIFTHYAESRIQFGS